ncbi:MAG: DUF4911 domain-containing protein [Nitrospinae bacterium]|nr:DUF4911 domain-containing protein [Nitrospinota bacterium]
MLEKGEKLVLKIESKRIVYFSILMSTYEGLGIVRTLDPKAAIVEVLTTKDMIGDLRALVKSLRSELYIEEI